MRMINNQNRTIWSGAGAPTGAIGADNDFYCDTANKIFYGPKMAGIWGAGFSMVGVAGANGDTRIKFAKTDLVTNASGVWSQNLGAGLFTNSPVVQVMPKMSGGSYDWRYQISGNAVAGFTVTIAFTRRANSISISIFGLLSLDAAISAVTFDLIASEPTP